MGIRAFVVKPLTGQELADMVSRGLDESGLRSQAFQK